MPGNPEYALGAIGENGEVFLNADDRGVPPRLQAYLASVKGYETNKYQLTEEQRAEITRRWSDVIQRYGYEQPQPAPTPTPMPPVDIVEPAIPECVASNAF